MRRSTMLLVMVLLPCVASAQTQVGVGGGGWLYASAYNPTNSSTMLIGSDMAGVMRSTDGGSSWTPWNNGLIQTKETQAQTTYVQDICPVSYNGFVGYYAATVGGIFKASDATGTWSNQTPLSDHWYEFRNLEEVDTTVVHLPIPFASLATAGSRVFAGAGLNRLTVPANVNEAWNNFSNAWVGYGGLHLPHTRFVTSSTDTAQASVWYVDMDSTASFRPYCQPCSFGAVRSISTAVLNDTTYVAVSTARGIYLHNGLEWRQLSDNPLYAFGQSTPLQGDYYGYGAGAKMAAWSIHLTQRGTLYAAMQRIDYTDGVNASGVYRIFDVTDGPNCNWTWVGNGESVDYDGQASGVVSGKSLYQIGLQNINYSYVFVRSFLIYLSVSDGSGEDPDRLYLGEARAGYGGVYRGEQPYSSDEDSGHWHLTVYASTVDGSWLNLRADGSGQDPADGGWISADHVMQPIAIHKPAISPQDADKVLLALNCTLLKTDDGYEYDNAYCSAGGSCWTTNGYTEMYTLDLAFTSDGHLLESNADCGLLLGCDASAGSLERLALPYSISRETGPVAVDRNVHGSGEDAIYAVGGESVAYFGPCAVFRRLRDSSTGDWVGDWQNVGPSLPANTTFTFRDLTTAGVDTCFVTYADAISGVITNFGVKRGVLSNGTWAWTSVNNGLAGVRPKAILYMAASGRLFVAARPGTSLGGVYMLSSPADTTWSLVYGGSTNLADFVSLAGAPYGEGEILFAGSAPSGSAVGHVNRCTDAGGSATTWTVLANPSALSSYSPTVNAIVAFPWSDGERVMANFDIGGMYLYNGPWNYTKARNGSARWDQALGGSAWAGMGASTLIFDPLNLGGMYMGTVGFEVLHLGFTPPSGQDPPPNPFQQRIVGDLKMRQGGDVSFELAVPSDVCITLYDVRGRLVRREQLRELSAGQHSFMWDGRDRSARRVASGTYFLRLEAGPQTITKKLVRVR